MKLRAPNWPIRVIAGLASLAFLAIVVTFLASLRVATQINGVVDLVQGIESGINDVIFFGLALFFLFTLESRLKRRDALKALHELRSIAHIVDMHQLTKDPEQILTPGAPNTPSSPPRAMSRFELARYLDYCTELLALTGKLASLHAQDLRDPVVLEAVNDLEALTVGLSRKIWQKITILDTIGPRVGSGGD